MSNVYRVRDYEEYIFIKFRFLYIMDFYERGGEKRIRVRGDGWI